MLVSGRLSPPSPSIAGAAGPGVVMAPGVAYRGHQLVSCTPLLWVLPRAKLPVDPDHLRRTTFLESPARLALGGSLPVSLEPTVMALHKVSGVSGLPAGGN
ncbi:hypothetical protein E2C01_084287 [Portunus trituberculatus]|uniref:Uncharacterized protein n=1 Tax=Portunus trituberculatus TaxID=210409 RepID=A0A5B7J5W7_PORTR|nr:hypothetical protein [Portunus trituberculatus]